MGRIHRSLPLDSDQADQAFSAGIVAYSNKDYAVAVQHLRTAAEAGHARAQYFLGTAYYNGDGVVRDHVQAARWFAKAADLGDGDAQCELGHAYDRGHGVARNPAVAARWYLKAAKQGNDSAQYDLGFGFYSNALNKSADKSGKYGAMDIAADFAGAVSFFQKAARQGNIFAQHDLALMYENGQGVARDPAAAKALMAQAAAGGHEEAKAWLDTHS